MPLKARIIIAVLSFLLFFFVLNKIRRRSLSIEYSILWLVVSSIILIISIWQNLGDQIAYFIGIDYPPALFFLIAILFLILIILHLSIELSKLKNQNKTLIQEISLIKKSIKKN